MGTGPEIEIAGGGPAGAAAALAALAEGSAVRVFEKSQFPRHKVCGEFLSPEILGVFDRLGVSEDFLALRPSRIHRARLHFGRRAKSWVLAEPAYGLSRSALDHLLLSIAEKRGAEVRRAAAPERSGDALRIAASGRRSAAEKGSRLFGFKAHFRGPCDDGVDLVFFNRCYAGVSAVEDGVVNICGLAPEAVLGAHGFDPDRLIAASPVLNERARGLSRTINWLITGPVVFRDAFDQPGGVYLAGDALGFVDPFTGSGILGAVLTGRMAGLAAARGIPPAEHLRACRRALCFQYRTAGWLRRIVENDWAGVLASLVPGKMLFELTRPRVAG